MVRPVLLFIVALAFDSVDVANVLGARFDFCQRLMRQKRSTPEPI